MSLTHRRWRRWGLAAIVLAGGAPGMVEAAPAAVLAGSPVPPCDLPTPGGRGPLYVAVEPGLAERAAAAVRKAGATSVVARGGGVVAFVGGVHASEEALAGAGVPATVAPDCAGARLELPNDPGFRSQWGLEAVRAPAAWDRTHGSAAPSVAVVVIDSGVDGTHPDLASKILPGYDAVRGAALDPGNTDVGGHGTAVAGVIAATPDNGGGLAGLGWDTRVVAVKDGDVNPVRSATVAGIRWAVDSGYRLINISAGYQAADPNETAAVAYARSKGAVVIASGGDAGGTGSPFNFPAALDGVVGVGAVGFDGTRARYSTTGDHIDLVAPGGSSDGESAHDIHVLAPNGGTAFRAGTSFSAPHVAAAAALVMAAGSLGPDQAVARLLTTARDLGPLGRDPEYGAGLLDVDAAVASTGIPIRRTQVTGYRMVASDGGIFAFGTAPFRGSTGNLQLAKPIVGMAATPSGNGYWLVAEDGGIFAFGDAQFRGSTGAMRLARPIVGMASTPSGDGYWLVAEDGGIFAFGDASFRGSTGATRLARPIVGMAATPSGNGYRLVASDGGVFAFGDATFRGSTGAITLAKPIVGMSSTPSGNGYRLVASDGGVFAFGDATFQGSTGAIRLAKPIVGMAATPSGNGYWLAAEDGGVFAFGDARFFGSTGGLPLAKPIVGMSAP